MQKLPNYLVTAVITNTESVPQSVFCEKQYRGFHVLCSMPILVAGKKQLFGGKTQRFRSKSAQRRKLKLECFFLIFDAIQ